MPPVFEVLDFLTAVTSVSVGFEEDDTVCELFLMVAVVSLVSISSFADVFPTEFHIERLSGHIYRNVDHYIAHHSNHFLSSV